jgi:hypothetical protein
MQKLHEKAMLTAFFYAKGIIHHEFVAENQTVNSVSGKWILVSSSA